MGETTYRLPPLFGLSRVGASVGQEGGRGNPDKDVILLQNSEIMLCLAILGPEALCGNRGRSTTRSFHTQK
jgi:hypothetical protein